MDKFEQNEMKKIRADDRLINYILKPITKIVGGFKDKVVSPFNLAPKVEKF